RPLSPRERALCSIKSHQDIANNDILNGGRGRNRTSAYAMINALRGHLAEHGAVAPQGAVQVKRLADAINEDTSQLPTMVRDLSQLYLEQIESLTAKIGDLDKGLR